MTDPRGAAVGALLVAMTSLLTGAALAKQLFPAVGAAGAASIRLLLAALILGAVWRPWRHHLSRAELAAVSAYGLSLGGMNLLIYQAISRVPLGVAVALEFTGPLAVALLGSRKPADFAWVALAAAGLALLLPASGPGDALDPVGVGFALAAGLCWALYIVFGRRVGRSVPSGPATALGMAVGAGLALPFGLATAGSDIFSPVILPVALSVALLSSVVPYSLEMVALKRLPATTFGVLMSLEPALGAVAGLAILGERLAPAQWVAVGCVVLASVGSTATARNPKPTPEVMA